MKTTVILLLALASRIFAADTKPVSTGFFGLVPGKPLATNIVVIRSDPAGKLVEPPAPYPGLKEYYVNSVMGTGAVYQVSGRTSGNDSQIEFNNLLKILSGKYGTPQPMDWIPESVGAGWFWVSGDMQIALHRADSYVALLYISKPFKKLNDELELKIRNTPQNIKGL